MPTTLQEQLPEYMQSVVSRTWKKNYLDCSPEKTDFIPDGKIQLSQVEVAEFFESYIREFQYLQRELKECLINIKQLKAYLIASILKEYRDKIDIDNFDIRSVYYLIEKNCLHVIDSKNSDYLTINVYKNQFTTFFRWMQKFAQVFPETTSSNCYNRLLIYANALSYVSKESLEDFVTGAPFYLYVSGKPDDILRMSITPCFDSCMNLYNGGSRKKLLSNVFDRNMKVAMIVSDRKYKDKYGNVHPMTIISRSALRKLEIPHTEPALYMDRMYPQGSRACYVMANILKKNGYNISERFHGYYTIFAEDIMGLPTPYMDTLSIKLKFLNDKKQLIEFVKNAHENANDYSLLLPHVKHPEIITAIFSALSFKNAIELLGVLFRKEISATRLPEVFKLCTTIKNLEKIASIKSRKWSGKTCREFIVRALELNCPIPTLVKILEMKKVLDCRIADTIALEILRQWSLANVGRTHYYKERKKATNHKMKKLFTSCSHILSESALRKIGCRYLSVEEIKVIIAKKNSKSLPS